MAGSLNKVMLIGHLGADPEVRSLPSGNKVVNLSVATSQSWKDKDSGERKEKTEWHRVVIFSEGLVKVASDYLKKGAKVYIEGALQTRKWQDKDGNDKYSTEIVLQGFNAALTMLDSKAEAEGRGGGQQQERREPARQDNAGRRPSSSAPAFDSNGDDEIPFDLASLVLRVVPTPARQSNERMSFLRHRQTAIGILRSQNDGRRTPKQMQNLRKIEGPSTSIKKRQRSRIRQAKILRGTGSPRANIRNIGCVEREKPRWLSRPRSSQRRDTPRKINKAAM